MEDTICAIATGLGAISVIRVSGKDAIFIVNKLFKEKDLTKTNSHSISYGHLYENDELLDEVLIMLMRAPKTYTKEDVIEINCHGGSTTVERILETLIKNGCRLAEPGEFTKRAFLNGRISLLEAESVNDLIKAKNDASRVMALNNLGGKLTQKIRNIREKMSKILANIEVNIDYPEYEDEVVITHDLLKEHLKEFIAELKIIKEESKNGKIINEGLNVAIIGKPNVGKSSILNFLLDEEKAIVTDIPGTTRDIVEGSISLNGILLNFIDTAGIRNTNDVVEKIGVEKSKKEAARADLIIFCLNYNETLSIDELNNIEFLKNKELIIFVNKNDLAKKIDVSKLNNFDIVYGNTKENKGLDDLKQKIKEQFALEKIVNKEMSYLSNVRQITLVEKALKSLENAEKALKDNLEVDLIEIDLKNAWQFLGELIGEAYTDELVDSIFSNFCLGK